MGNILTKFQDYLVSSESSNYSLYFVKLRLGFKANITAWNKLPVGNLMAVYQIDTNLKSKSIKTI